MPFGDYVPERRGTTACRSATLFTTLVEIRIRFGAGGTVNNTIRLPSAETSYCACSLKKGNVIDNDGRRAVTVNSAPADMVAISMVVAVA